MNKSRLWEHLFSILPKIIFVFLIVILPLYLFSLYLINRGEESVRRELSESLNSRARLYMSLFESDMVRLLRLQQQFIIDKDLQRISFAEPVMDRFEMSQRMLQVQNKLRLLKNASDYVLEVSAYIPPVNRTITSSAIVPMNEEEFLHLSQEAEGDRGPGGEIVQWNDRLFVRLAYPNVPHYNKVAAYALAIELDAARIRQSLSRINNSEQSGALMRHAGHQWYITSDVNAERIEGLKSDIALTPDNPATGGNRLIVWNGKSYLTAVEASNQLDLTLLVYVPINDILGPLKGYERWVWFFTLTAVLIMVIFAFWIRKMIHQPLKQLVGSLRKVEKGVLEQMPSVRRRDEFSYLFRQYNAMVAQLKVLIHQIYEHKIRSQSSELKQLQSQINPHFLYNTYFILYRLAKMNEIEKVVMYSQHLGEYFQYMTRNSGSSVALHEELEHTRTYVAIQQVRFSNRISVQFDETPPRFRQMIVPKLFLQPILENAYKYGMEQMEEDGFIRISFRQCDDALGIVVEDNGRQLTDDRLADLQIKLDNRDTQVETTGLLNVHRRLRLMCGSKGGLELARSSLGGLQAVLNLGRGADGETARKLDA